MRIGTMIRFSPGASPDDRLFDRIADYARRIEAAGYPGIWVGDSLGRGRPTVDPLVALMALAAVTSRVELGVSVVQVPLRHPIELAHRVQSVQVLSGNRLRLGVGSGSTKADFDLLGYDYDKRFGTLRTSLDIMRRAWRGEPSNSGGVLSTWPGCEGGPPILIGAWRSPRWITLAAKEYQGWTPSGRFSNWADLEHGMRIYREAGGSNAVLANLAVDFSDSAEAAELARVAELSLIGTPDVVREKLQRLKRIGFDEVLLVSPRDELADIQRARDLV
jgi:alkanesulfonate monooxygenase SsuD/methylene tetrahydromethanopterin reductase-like flavin-dependent oxidoreductase (luciferase family)